MEEYYGTRKNFVRILVVQTVWRTQLRQRMICILGVCAAEERSLGFMHSIGTRVLRAPYNSALTLSLETHTHSTHTHFPSTSRLSFPPLFL
jgi:hypothetical protein